MDYLKWLEDYFHETFEYHKGNKYVYLADYIFDFALYDDRHSDRFGRLGLEFCKAVSDRTTFELYEKDEETYLFLANSACFIHLMTWGTSVRGAFWDSDLEATILGLGNLNREEWIKFVEAMVEFVRAVTAR